MQPPLRVFILAENRREARKLSAVFEQFPGLAVVEVSKFAAPPLDLKAFDVLVVKGRNPTELVGQRGSVPTLYLVPPVGSGPNDFGRAGALLPTNASDPQIRAAAMAVAAGLAVGQAANIRQTDPEWESAFLEPLTERELNILNLVADGLSNPEIARRLGISRNTVKFHVSSIISKLGATSRTDAVTIGVKRGLILV